jgi:dihydroflavonol-4-reductase
MRIGILGATGMLGHHSANAVRAAGHELVVLHRAGAKLDRLCELKFGTRMADLDQPATLLPALRGLDGVINAAAYYPTVPRPWRDDVAEGLRQMQAFFDACAQAHVARVVYVGGSIALRRDPKGLPGNETLVQAHEPDDKAPYVQVKWALDRLAHERAAGGLPVITAIPTMSFGEHDWGPTTGRLLVELANRTLAGYVAGDRNVVYAGDAGRGILASLERGRPGERYLIGGHNVAMADLVARMAAIAGAPAPRAIPLPVARAAAKMQALRYHLIGGAAPKLSETAIAIMASGQFLDCGKAERELGYSAKVGVEEMLMRAFTWFRSIGYINTGGQVGVSV